MATNLTESESLALDEYLARRYPAGRRNASRAIGDILRNLLVAEGLLTSDGKYVNPPPPNAP